MGLFGIFILLFENHLLKKEHWFLELERKKYCEMNWEKDIYPPKFN